MPKVFFSYASENREIVERYAAELSARGHEVWWDSQIYGGDDWGQTIERELNRSNCVVIFWSKYSIDSPWVRIEAHYARQHNCMVPVRLDEVPLPDEHRMLQAIDGTSDDIGASVDAVQRAIEGIQRRSRQGKARGGEELPGTGRAGIVADLVHRFLEDTYERPMVSDDFGVWCPPEVVIKLPETPYETEAFELCR